MEFCIKLMSHPLWVRGLKWDTHPHAGCDVLSHPLWVRGLKLTDGRSHRPGPRRRTPCGCVD